MSSVAVRDPTDVLRAANTVVVIGASTRIHRPSHHAVEMLVETGYNVIPVNPRYDHVLGLTCLSDYSLVPDSTKIDIVNVFRRPDAVPDLLDQVAERMSRVGRSPVVWTQLGVSSPESVKKAAEFGLAYIEERCIMVELERLAGKPR